MWSIFQKLLCLKCHVAVVFSAGNQTKSLCVLDKSCSFCLLVWICLILRLGFFVWPWLFWTRSVGHVGLKLKRATCFCLPSEFNLIPIKGVCHHCQASLLCYRSHMHFLNSVITILCMESKILSLPLQPYRNQKLFPRMPLFLTIGPKPSTGTIIEII